MPWYVPAMLTAALWGFLYVMAEYVTKGITKTSYLLICTLIQVVVFGACAIGQNRLVSDVQHLFKNPLALVSILLVVLASIGGNYLSLVAIQMKNASAAAAVETTYPLWAALFAYVLFGQIQLSPVGVAGTLLVMIGICLIIFSQG